MHEPVAAGVGRAVVLAGVHVAGIPIVALLAASYEDPVAAHKVVGGAPPHGEEGAARVELLDAPASGDVDVPAPVGRHAGEDGGEVELAGARAETPPRGEEGAARVELLDAVVVHIRDVDVPAPVGRHAGGVVELAGAR